VDVEIDDDEEPRGTARAVDSDDDRPVSPLTEEDMELILFCPDGDPLVHKFSDVSHSRSAFAEGRDDGLLILEIAWKSGRAFYSRTCIH
jgi:hypothetical protein